MNALERYVILSGEVGNLVEKETGVNLIDAYFGPDNLAPKNQQKDRPSNDLIHELEELKEKISEEITDRIHETYLLAEIDSFKTVVQWLSGSEMSYSHLVEALFHIPLEKFSEKEIDVVIDTVEDLTKDISGKDVHERVINFSKEGEIQGEELSDLIENVLQPKAREVGELFQKRIFSKMKISVTDNGVLYSSVTDKPWSGYNYYQGDYKSLNEFNVDRPMNKDSLLGVIYHEYEHHVSNLWRERKYRIDGNLDLSTVPLHTGRCVISEGTADTAKDFLGVRESTQRERIFDALYILRRMTSINAAIMMNHEKESTEEAVDYMVYRGLRTESSAKGSLGFIGPKNSDGSPNIWAPYIITYFIGRTEFVLPTFEKARNQDMIPEFFKTIYLNPYAGSSATWEMAFDWL